MRGRVLEVMNLNLELRRLVYTALLAALTVALSTVVIIPVGPTKVQPMQHAMNVIAGIFLGPWYAMLGAVITGLVRNFMGTGTVFAFPGGIPGALLVGLAYKYTKKDWAALLEPVGTGPIGATLSVYLVAPLVDRTMAFWTIQTAFLASSILGTYIGLVLVLALKRARVHEIIKLQPPAQSKGTSGEKDANRRRGKKG
jgi:energy coupling factor transporter S component ThiW